MITFTRVATLGGNELIASTDENRFGQHWPTVRGDRCVVIDTAEGEHIYLAPADAEALAMALIRLADKCR